MYTVEGCDSTNVQLRIVDNFKFLRDFVKKDYTAIHLVLFLSFNIDSHDWKVEKKMLLIVSRK